MSYCRWSCDDFECDLYCYSDLSGGWTIHVAEKRHVGKAPSVASAFDKPFDGSGTTGEAARLEGFNCLLMEAEPDYAAFLKARFRRDDPPGLAGDIFG